MAVLARPFRLKQARLRDVPGLRPPACQFRGAGRWPHAVFSGVGLPLNNNNNIQQKQQQQLQQQLQQQQHLCLNKKVYLASKKVYFLDLVPQFT